MKADRYRRERRRRRCDLLLIARGVDRETRRRIWRAGRRGFTSLSRAAWAVLDDHPNGFDIWLRIFPHRDVEAEALAAAGRAAIRRARKLVNRRRQRERMKAHQQSAHAARTSAGEWAARAAAAEEVARG